MIPVGGVFIYKNKAISVLLQPRSKCIRYRKDYVLVHSLDRTHCHKSSYSALDNRLNRLV